MAVDASGTPTSPDSIPTYATSADAPSGKGFNAAMAAIQTALSGRWLKTLFTTTGDIAYASSASTPARLGIGSSGNVLTVSGGLPAWVAPTTSGSTTVSTWAGGPPGSPADKDIWVATAVDANGTRWQFQYNAGSASTYKWEFIGGPPVQIVSGGTINLPLSAWTTVLSWTAGRGGDYMVPFAWYAGTNNAATTQLVLAGISASAAAPATPSFNQTPADTFSHTMVAQGTALSVAATTGTVTLMGDPQTLQFNCAEATMQITPKRVI